MKKVVIIWLSILVLGCSSQRNISKVDNFEKLVTNPIFNGFKKVEINLAESKSEQSLTYIGDSGTIFWIAGGDEACTDERPCLSFSKSGNTSYITIIQGVSKIKFILVWHSETSSLLKVVMNNGNQKDVVYFDYGADGVLDSFKYPPLSKEEMDQVSPNRKEGLQGVFEDILSFYFKREFLNKK